MLPESTIIKRIFDLPMPVRTLSEIKAGEVEDEDVHLQGLHLASDPPENARLLKHMSVNASGKPGFLLSAMPAGSSFRKPIGVSVIPETVYKHGRLLNGQFTDEHEADLTSEKRN